MDLNPSKDGAQPPPKNQPAKYLFAVEKVSDKEHEGQGIVPSSRPQEAKATGKWAKYFYEVPCREREGQGTAQSFRSQEVKVTDNPTKDSAQQLSTTQPAKETSAVEEISGKKHEGQGIGQSFRPQEAKATNKWPKYFHKDELDKEELEARQMFQKLLLTNAANQGSNASHTVPKLPSPAINTQTLPQRSASDSSHNATKQIGYVKDTGNISQPRSQSYQHPIITGYQPNSQSYQNPAGTTGWSDKKLSEMRAELRTRDLSPWGTKKVVAARLEASDRQRSLPNAQIPEHADPKNFVIGRKHGRENDNYQMLAPPLKYSTSNNPGFGRSISQPYPPTAPSYPGGNPRSSSQPFRLIPPAYPTPNPYARGNGSIADSSVVSTHSYAQGIDGGSGSSQNTGITIHSGSHSSAPFFRGPLPPISSLTSLPSLPPRPTTQFGSRQQAIQQVHKILEALQSDKHPDSVQALAAISNKLAPSTEAERNAEREYRLFREFIDGYKSYSTLPSDDLHKKVNPWVTFGEVHGLVCFHVEEGMHDLVERMEGLEATIGLKDTSPAERAPFGGIYQRSFMKVDNTIANMEERLARVEEYLCGSEERSNRGATRFVEEGCPPISEDFVRPLLKDDYREWKAATMNQLPNRESEDISAE